jgi:hypothetical protein
MISPGLQTTLRKSWECRPSRTPDSQRHQIFGNVSEVDFEPKVCHDAGLFPRRMSWYSFPCSVPTVPAIRCSRAEPPELANNAIAAQTQTAATIPLCSIPLLMDTHPESKNNSLPGLSMAVACETQHGCGKSVLQRSLTSGKKRANPQQREPSTARSIEPRGGSCGDSAC